MPQPFHQLTLDRFDGLLNAFSFTRRIESVHLHHTWRPDHSQYDGHASIVAMWRYHTGVNHWSDIAQHVSIAPDGTIWTGRNWNVAPASARGYNGTSAVGPFMIEMIGDFDIGRDPFVDPQRAAVLEVIARVQRRFGLAPDALRFHNSMTRLKSCPGTQLNRAALIADITVLHASLAASETGRGARAALPFDDDQTQLNRIAMTLARSAPSTVDERDSEPAEEDGSAAEREVLAGVRPVMAGENYDGNADGQLSSMSDLESLRPHVVNLHRGRLSDDGMFRTRPEDIDAIFQLHLPTYVARARAAGVTPRLVIFAHGGLVPERSGLAVAHKQTAWWKRAGVYPIFFVWETGLADTVADIVAGQLWRQAPAVTTTRATRGLFPERLWNRLVEHSARGARASRIWDAMKHSAAAASGDGGGARQVMERLRLFTEENPDLELHAIGHSAGSIFHAHMLPLAVQLGLRFQTLQLLAPAVRVDEFRARMAPLLAAAGGVEACTIFTMLDDYEEADVCQLPLLQDYGRSLLYLVHQALEDRPGTPILGLERSLRGDPELVSLLALNGGGGNHRVVWSMSNSSTGRSASMATAHGAFDDDRATMESVLRRVLSLADSDDVTPFPAVAARDIRVGPRLDQDEEVGLLIEALTLAPASAGTTGGTTTGVSGGAGGGADGGIGTLRHSGERRNPWDSATAPWVPASAGTTGGTTTGVSGGAGGGADGGADGDIGTLRHSGERRNPWDSATAPWVPASAGTTTGAAGDASGSASGSPSGSPSGSAGGSAPAAATGNGDTGRSGRKLALCVGIDAYPGRDRLSGCVRDASQWQEVLQGIGFTVTTLTDGQATRQAIEAGLGRLIDEARPGDTVIFQYAGHGTEVPDVNGDETGGNNGRKDEALCPVDYVDGHLFIDDDIGAILDRARPGVSITCFMDCCHSGTISRVALGEPPEPAGQSRRARCLVLPPEAIARHRSFREQLTVGSRKLDLRRRNAMPEVVFSACRDIEVAWETNGQGAFTCRAAPLLARAVAERWSNVAFFEQVKAAFGTEPSQHPILDCAPPARAMSILGAAVVGQSGPGVAIPAEVPFGSSHPPAAWSQ